MIDALTALLSNSAILVGLSAFLATFVASVMADEQNDRLRQGTFGAIAGGAVGGFASILEKNGNLLLVGVFGSASGAIVGWVVYLGMSVLASRKWGRSLVEYHVSGLKGVRTQIDLESQHLLLKALTLWSQNYRGMVLREAQVILANAKSADYDRWVTVALRAWLISLVDAFNLVLDALAEKPEYRSRISIIVFGVREDNGKFVGRHWISYSGELAGHRKTDFDESSIACKVLTGSLGSPNFTTIESADKDGQNRGDKSYSSFYVFRLNDRAVLSLDWPKKTDAEDEYMSLARRLLYLDVAPAIGKLLDCWRTGLSEEVGLLAAPAGKAAAAAVVANGAAVVSEAEPTLYPAAKA